MKRLFKPYSLLLYLLAILMFFFIGIIYAGWVGAGKNQGLAAAAIVLGYGVISAISGWVIALIAAYKFPAKTVININKILAISVLGCLAWFSWKYYTRAATKQEEVQPVTPTAAPTAISDLYCSVTANLYKMDLQH